jgi:hypothetical protein
MRVSESQACHDATLARETVMAKFAVFVAPTLFPVTLSALTGAVAPDCTTRMAAIRETPVVSMPGNDSWNPAVFAGVDTPLSDAGGETAPPLAPAKTRRMTASVVRAPLNSGNSTSISAAPDNSYASTSRPVYEARAGPN